MRFPGRRQREPRGRTADLLVVGLCNPGESYTGSRHNVGGEVVDVLARRHGATLKRAVGRALSAEVPVGDRLLVLAVPGTYMNLSGETVAPLVRRYCPEEPERLVVVHDELDLPVGRLKIKVGGGLAGHNGLKSVKAHLHTDVFTRVRIGVGKPPSKERGADHVLRAPGKRDREELELVVQEAADAVEMILAEGTSTAMTRYNTAT